LAMAASPGYYPSGRLVSGEFRDYFAACGGVPERSNGAVSKTVAAHPSQYRSLAFGPDFCGLPRVPQSLYPAPYRPVPPSWVAKWVAAQSSCRLTPQRETVD